MKNQRYLLLLLIPLFLIIWYLLFPKYAVVSSSQRTIKYNRITGKAYYLRNMDWRPIGKFVKKRKTTKKRLFKDVSSKGTFEGLITTEELFGKTPKGLLKK